ncbi:MAG: hypothetical protein H0T73_04880, partial [Ardenticatenales bacterium]|nr:hypothetical protein [Ardenticatenales bacterium]
YAIGDVEVMFIPAWLALTVLAFGGIALVVRHLLIAPDLSARVALLLSLALLLVPLRLQLGEMPLSRAGHEAPRARVDEILAANPPPNAILVTNDRDDLVPLWYAQFAEGQRPDLLVLAPLITPAPEHRTVAALVQWALQWGRPVLLAKPMAGLEQRFDLHPHAGPLVAVQGPAAMPTEPPLQPDLAPALSVIGWEPTALRVQPGDLVTLSIALLPNAPLHEKLSFSLQLFDAAGTPIAQAEFPPDPFYPPTEWPAGEPARLLVSLVIPAETAEGLYEWRLSSYLLEGEQFTAVGQQVRIGRFQVVGVE